MNYLQENLINKLNISNEDDVSFLIGAGCSIESGCMGSGKLINEFKKRIYCAKNGLTLDDSTLINDEHFNKILNEEYPSNMRNPYSYYFEKCFPNPNDRNKFIKECFLNVSPSYGYLCFADYLIRNKIKTVLTTNFDNLIEKAVNKLNANYDISVQSDNICPLQNSKLNLIKLHGDYNYDLLKNTEEELLSLSEQILHTFDSVKYKTIVVIGYSGMDESVMKAFEILSKQGVEIIWCCLDESYLNDRIRNILKNNNSGYCVIKGFEDLFSKLYSFQKTKNNVIDEISKNLKNINFDLNITNQPEQIEFNANVLISSPMCYVIKKSINNDKIKQINEEYLDSFVLQYKESLYIVGNINKIVNVLGVAFKSVLNVTICEEDIPFVLKCKLIKESIKIYCRSRQIGVYKDNIYIKNNKIIKEGLEINIDLFKENICLFSNVNYFVVNDQDINKFKTQISQIKSNLYSSGNYKKRKELLEKLFNNSLRFELNDSIIEFDKNPLSNKGNKINFYNCADEPNLVVDKNFSCNQIKLLNEFGPRSTQFSIDKIKVGVFCLEEDKLQLKNYLDLLVNGTNRKGKEDSIIPQYLGFEKIFKKQIEILYDALPSFNHKTILKLSDENKLSIFEFTDFCMRGIKKLYDEKQVDIVIIYISNKLASYRTKEDFDLHDNIKLLCSNKYKTQFIEEKSIKSVDDINKKIYNLAIGIYTKTVGMSWYPKEYSKDTLFLGMSFGKEKKGITVGCSQMFDGAGRGMQLIISKISDKHRKNQYLSNDEAYNLGMKIRTTYCKASKIGNPKRVVIHRSSPFMQEEIEGFKKAFEGIEDFDLIEFSDYTHFNGYKIKNDICQGYPVKRGTTIKISRDSAFVWTDGSINSYEILNGKTYRNNKRGMGKPIKIKKYYGNITINQVVDDLMYLTKMDFNSSDIIYSKIPVTIKYSQIVCKLLKQGSFDDDLISFEYIM